MEFTIANKYGSNDDKPKNTNEVKQNENLIVFLIHCESDFYTVAPSYFDK